MKIYWIPILSAAVLTAGCERDTGGTADTRRTETGYASNNVYQGTKTATEAADNTGRNVRDRNDATLTPGDQGTSESDREITRKLRREITANPELSVTAKNIKIITVNGAVTIRGPVATEQERQAIESIVQRQGIQNLNNQLEVKTTTQ